MLSPRTFRHMGCRAGCPSWRGSSAWSLHVPGEHLTSPRPPARACYPSSASWCTPASAPSSCVERCHWSSSPVPTGCVCPEGCLPPIPRAPARLRSSQLGRELPRARSSLASLHIPGCSCGVSHTVRALKMHGGETRTLLLGVDACGCP